MIAWITQIGNLTDCVFDNQRYIRYYKDGMKLMLIKKRRVLFKAVPALMLLLLLASISVSAFHNHHDCGNSDNCAICTFQLSNYAPSIQTAAGSSLYREPVLLAFVSLPERVCHPFHTRVFASHAPPQFS